MAVVVDDFEVVPAPEPERGSTAEAPQRPDHATPGFAVGVERALRHRAERLERLRAD